MTVAVEQGGTRKIEIRRIPLTVLAAILWALGWSASKVVLALLWVAAALKLGWADAQQRRD